MGNVDDGGPAWPQVRTISGPLGEHQAGPAYQGVTVRDWFAGQVLAGCQYEDAMTFGAIDDGTAQSSADDYAKMAYAIADAMLAARKAGAP